MMRRMILSIAGAVMLLVAVSFAFEPWKGDVDIVKAGTATLDTDATSTAHYADDALTNSAPAASLSGPATYSITVNSVDIFGHVKTGMYTTIREGGIAIKTGYTPMSYTGKADATYSVTVANYGSSTFSHWENDSISNRRTVTLDSDKTVTAYYKAESVSTITPPMSAPGSSSSENRDFLIPKTGVLVSLYMYPSTAGWTHYQTVIDSKNAHPSVPIVAIVNPSSGPGKLQISAFVNAVDRLQDAGITVIGYVPDDYATRSPSALRADVEKYWDWYKVDGIFIDEFTNKPGHENRYSELTAYAKSLGMKMTVANPGADVPQSYIGTVDVINITEGKGYVPISWLEHCTNCSAEKGWHYQYNKRNFALVRYDIPTLDTAYVTEASKWVGLMYITDGNDSNKRWFHVPPYFGDLVAKLDQS